MNVMGLCAAIRFAMRFVVFASYVFRIRYAMYMPVFILRMRALLGISHAHRFAMMVMGHDLQQ
jgi:hypothetical protein